MSNTGPPDSSPGAPARPSSALSTYHPALDGLRAVAMAFMLAYHGELEWAKGAFLSLSQFFTLSGFLITSILLRRWSKTGTVDLVSFWSQRYRRLMPAALLTLVGVIVFGATVAGPYQVREIPGQVTAAALQVVNWYFIYTEKSYIDLFAAPSPVQHFWSLAVEEQFYIFMPLVFLALITWTKSLRSIGAFFLLGTLASTAWMIWLYHQGASLDRLYYGTDTRAAELLAGGLLAVLLARYPLNLGERGRRLLAVAGVIALAITTWGWTSLELADGPIWQGGYTLFSLITCVLIVSILSGGPVKAVLAWGFLPAMGRITYGLYLYHWPLFLWLDEEYTGLDGWYLFTLRMVVTFALAIASYNLLEMPIRNGFPSRLKKSVRWTIAPTCIVLIVGAAYLAGNREIDTEQLSPLATPISEEAPTIAGDEILNVLVVADASAAKVVAALEARAAESENLAVTVAEPLRCDGIASMDDGTQTCAEWLQEWPALIDDVNPDVVLFFVSRWDLAETPKFSDTGPASDHTEALAWTESALRGGLGLLSAQGAPVIWARMPTSVEEELRSPYDPFNIAMNQLLKEDMSIRQILQTEFPAGIDPESDAFAQAALDPVLESLELYRRPDPGSLPRVMVVGDSVARTFGYGLERWAADTQAAQVWTTATLGCGLADEGFIKSEWYANREQALAESCQRVHEGWKKQIEQFNPDLVIVMSSIWDTQERRLPDWSQMKLPGDPAFDEYLLREYRESVDELTAGGAAILWVQQPCARSMEVNGVKGASTGKYDTARVRYLNESLIPRLVEARPEVRTYDLFSELCPQGEFVESMGGVEQLRPDGVHFSTEGSLWLAYTFGGDMLEAGLKEDESQTDTQ